MEHTKGPCRRKYVVRLSDDELRHLTSVVKIFSGSNQKVRRAQLLLQWRDLIHPEARLSSVMRSRWQPMIWQR